MVDFFLLLMLSGGGDELQGIKRGIMEMADHILINKADKENIKAAGKAREAYKNAIHLWKKHGFEIIGTIPKAFDHKTLGYVDALIMWRDLTD